MFGLFKKSPASPSGVPKTPTPSPVTGAPAASTPKLSFLNKVSRTLKNARNDPIPDYTKFPAEDDFDAHVKIHKRFDTLFERHHESADPRIKFLVNQLLINRTVCESLSKKKVLVKEDRDIVKSLFHPLRPLFDILISDEQASLREELKNYNAFLSHVFDHGIRRMMHMQERYERELKKGKVVPKQLNAAGNAEKTQKAQQAQLDMLDGLSRLPMMSASMQRKLNASKAELKGALTTFAAASKTADATSAALATGLASALNGSAGPTMGPNNLARIQRQVGEVEAGLNANNEVAQMHKELNALNSKVSKYTGLNNAEPTNAELNAYLNRLHQEQTNAMLAKMPMPPTSAPKGGKRTRKQRRNKTRKHKRN